MLERLRARLKGHPQVLEVRGRGLMIGIELLQAIPGLTRLAAQDHGLLINVTRGKVIRLLPPLVLDAAEVALIVEGVAATLDSVISLQQERLA